MAEDRVVVRVTLRDPPPDAPVAQVITYPVAAATVARSAMPDPALSA